VIEERGSGEDEREFTGIDGIRSEKELREELDSGGFPSTYCIVYEKPVKHRLLLLL
jgi:hypothetical protein